MWVFFGDDSKQGNPSRPGMGSPLVGAAAVGLDGDSLQQFENELESTCGDYGFPAGEEFKWSPGRERWMWKNLVGSQRRDFFLDVIDVALRFEARVAVVVRDASRRPFGVPGDPEVDAFVRLLERLSRALGDLGTTGMLISDRLSDHKRERQFLLAMKEAMELLNRQSRTIAVNTVTTDSDLIRSLQFADLVAACAIARVSGEDRFSPVIFEALTPMFLRTEGRAGGYGLEIGPGLDYVNLYHWLVHDEVYRRGPLATPLPVARWRYPESETDEG